MLTEAAEAFYGSPALWTKERMRKALRAIAPMVEELTKKHVDAGYDFALKLADELFKDADDYWWISSQLEKLEIPK